MTNFEKILAALRATNGVAIDDHNTSDATIKIDAIAMFGDREVVAMFDGQYFSLNGLYLDKEGAVRLSTYSWGVIYPEMIGATVQETADEWNKPEHHTPGLSYQKLTQVTPIIEQKETVMNIPANIQSIITSLNLTKAAHNPMPGADELSTQLYLSADNKLQFAVTKVDSKEEAMSVLGIVGQGLELVNDMGVMKAYSSQVNEVLDGYLDRQWFNTMLGDRTQWAAYITGTMETVPLDDIFTDALNMTIATNDGYVISLTEMMTFAVIDSEMLTKFLDGTFMREALAKQSGNIFNSLAANPELGEKAMNLADNKFMQVTMDDMESKLSA